MSFVSKGLSDKIGRFHYASRLCMIGVVSAAMVIAAPMPVRAADPISSLLLDGLAEKIKDLIAQFEAAGDRLAKSVAEQALRVIEGMELSSTNVVNEVSDEIAERQRQLYADVQQTIDRLSDERETIVRDANQLGPVDNPASHFP